MLYYLIYCSIASELMTDEDLRVLLKQARAKNRELVITGMLVYVEGKYSTDTQGRFMQVLEGSRFLIEELFDKIAHDSRHREVVVLERGAIAKRSFKTWDMGFERIEEFPPANTALGFLKRFYEGKQEGKGIDG